MDSGKIHPASLPVYCGSMWEQQATWTDLDSENIHRYRKQRADHNASKCRQTDRLVGTALVGTTGSCTSNMRQMRISSFQT